jgi:hypothetical protein
MEYWKKCIETQGDYAAKYDRVYYIKFVALDGACYSFMYQGEYHLKMSP